MVFCGVWLRFLTVEDIVRADVDAKGGEFSASLRHVPCTQRIHAECLPGSVFALSHAHESGAVDDDDRARCVDGAMDTLGVRDVDIISCECNDITAAGRPQDGNEIATELSPAAKNSNASHGTDCCHRRRHTTS